MNGPPSEESPPPQPEPSAGTHPAATGSETLPARIPQPRGRGPRHAQRRLAIIGLLVLAIASFFILAAILSVDTQPRNTVVPLREPSALEVTELEPTDPDPSATPGKPPGILVDPNSNLFALVVACGLLALALSFLAYFFGIVTLSPQSLSHRRNMLAAASVLFLASVVKLQPLAAFGLGDPGAQDPSEACSAQSVARGIVTFFMLYASLEYAFSFTADYVKSLADWGTKRAHIGVLAHGALIPVGFYRLLFDVLIPLSAIAYVGHFFLSDAGCFFEEARTTIVCNVRKDLQPSIDSYRAHLDATLAAMDRRCPACRSTRERLARMTTEPQQYLSGLVTVTQEDCAASPMALIPTPQCAPCVPTPAATADRPPQAQPSLRLHP